MGGSLSAVRADTRSKGIGGRGQEALRVYGAGRIWDCINWLAENIYCI